MTSLLEEMNEMKSLGYSPLEIEDYKNNQIEEMKTFGFSDEDIYKELVMNSYDIGLATVYRVLTQFENAGMVVKHKFEENKAVYELNDPQHHDHMVCVETGAITEFHDETIKKKQREIAEKHGYDLLDQSVILYVRKKKN